MSVNSNLCHYLDSTALPLGVSGSIRGLIGDSLTVGGLASLLADRYGWTADITAKGGDAVADQADEAFMFAPAQGDIFVVWLGTNDKNLGGNIANREAVTKAGHLAVLLNLATKEGINKVRAQSMTPGGTWSNMTAPIDATGRLSATNGSTLSCSVSGTSVSVVGWWNALQTGQFSVSIDGVDQGTFSSTPPGAFMVSNQGLQHGPFALEFTGLSAGAHTVLITVTSATNVNNVVYVSFVAGYAGGTSNPADPLVIVNNLHDYTAAANVAQGTTTAQNAVYKAMFSANVAICRNKGLNVKIVETDPIIGNNAALLGPDGLHPIHAGYMAVRDADAAAIG